MTRRRHLLARDIEVGDLVRYPGMLGAHQAMYTGLVVELKYDRTREHIGPVSVVIERLPLGTQFRDEVDILTVHKVRYEQKEEEE